MKRLLIATATAFLMIAGYAQAATSETCTSNGKRQVCIVTLEGTFTGSTVGNIVNEYPQNTAVVVKGFDATVNGVIPVWHPRTTIVGLTSTDTVTVYHTARFTTLRHIKAKGLDIFGASDVLVADSHFDGRGDDSQNLIYDNGGKIPRRIRIVRNTFENFYRPVYGDHSEALFIGYSAEGRIYSNTFRNNGTTAHIFFTWWGATADPATSYARAWCVRKNTYSQRRGYYDIQHRAEIPPSSNIRVGFDDTDSITASWMKGNCP